MATTLFPASEPPISCDLNAGSMDLQVSTTPSAVTAEEWAAPAEMSSATGLEISLWPLWKTTSQPLACPVAAELERLISLEPAVGTLSEGCQHVESCACIKLCLLIQVWACSGSRQMLTSQDDSLGNDHPVPPSEDCAFAGQHHCVTLGCCNCCDVSPLHHVGKVRLWMSISDMLAFCLLLAAFQWDGSLDSTFWYSQPLMTARA